MITPSSHSGLDKERQLALLDELGFAVWVFDGTDTRYANHALSEITGYTVDELLRPGFFEQLIHPDFLELILERGRARVRGEEVPTHYDIAVRARTGDLRWLSLHARRIELEDGPASLVSATDVTELRRAQDVINSGAGRIRMLLDLVPAHIITTDPDGKPTFVNRHWLEYTGLSMEEAMASGTASVVHADDSKAAATAWTAAKKTVQGYDIDYRVRTETGEYRWNSFRIRPLLGESGDLLGWISASVDVHQAREMEGELREANERLEMANRAKDDMLGLVSHELRTPLTTLRGNASALRRHAGRLEPDVVDTALADIDRDSERLQRIVENMLTLARGASSSEFEAEPLLLRRIVLEMVAEHRARIPGSQFEVSVPEALVPVLGDDTYVRQILANLFSNATKYGGKGGLISVALRREGDQAVISVSDRGIGIRQELLTSVFEPFYRSPEGQRSAGGIGLGLAVCRLLVELQGGRIWAEQREGGGTTFSFTLPIASDDAD